MTALIGFSGAWEHGPFETLFSLATLLPTLAVTARRLHDIGKSGWWQLGWYAILFIAWLAAGIMFIVAVVITYGATGGTNGVAYSSGEGWSVRGADIQWESVVGEAFAFLPAAIMLIAALAITVAVIVWSIIWMARRGEAGENRFGPDPRA